MIDWDAPKEPGVYLFKDGRGGLLYVGKAKSLRDRLSSYRGTSLPVKTAQLLREAQSLEYIVCRNESEALVLENTLIKQHRPAYNITLKDNTPYAYLKITSEPFPRILTVRKRDASRNEKLLGPFVSGAGRSVAVREVTRTFGLRICNPLPAEACLQYHLGFCTAPCIGKISPADYAQNVKRAHAVLSGRTEPVEEALQKEMHTASARLDYERALQLRERLTALERIKQRQLMDVQQKGNEDFFGFIQDGPTLHCCVLGSRNGVISNRESYSLDAIGESPSVQTILRYYDDRPLPHRVYADSGSPQENSALGTLLAQRGAQLVVPQRGDKLELVKLAERNAALGKARSREGLSAQTLSLQKALGLSRPPLLIDCFDVSNLAGKQNVGSCVRLVDGKTEKASYRRFRIRDVRGQDDFASLHEIVYRRYRGALQKAERLPDLVLIDGGPGQLHAAMNALGELHLEPSVAALAKREEDVYLPDRQAPLRLGRHHEGLKLLQRCRDEAHRFALAYNRKRREMERGF